MQTNIITNELRADRRAYYAANRERISEYRKNYRERTNNQSTKKYEKTKNGFLMRCYRNMQSRVQGIQKLKAHLYKDNFLLDRQTFYDWSLNNEEFHRLFDEWEDNHYNQKLSPSINRIVPEKGYAINNIEWITHSENSRRTRRWLH